MSRSNAEWERDYGSQSRAVLRIRWSSTTSPDRSRSGFNRAAGSVARMHADAGRLTNNGSEADHPISCGTGRLARGIARCQTGRIPRGVAGIIASGSKRSRGGGERASPDHQDRQRLPQ